MTGPAHAYCMEPCLLTCARVSRACSLHTWPHLPASPPTCALQVPGHVCQDTSSQGGTQPCRPPGDPE